LVIDPDTLGIGSNSNTNRSTPSHDSNGNSSSTSGAGSLPDDKRPTSGRIPQTWLPNGKTACYWRSLIAILEEELNCYLSYNELIALRNKGLESDLGIDGKKTLGADYKVESWQKVLGDAFSLYDREINPYAGSSDGAKAGIIKLSKVDETNILSGEYRDTSLEFAYGIANHYQLADKSGSLKWDPWGRNLSGGYNLPKETLYVHY
jgi:hypothetical protein